MILTKYYLGSKSFINVIAEGTKALSPSPLPKVLGVYILQVSCYQLGFFYTDSGFSKHTCQNCQIFRNVDNNYLGLHSGYIMKFVHKIKVCDHCL